MMFIAMLVMYLLVICIVIGIGLIILSTVFIIIGKCKNKRVLRILSYIGYSSSVFFIIPGALFVWFLIARPDLKKLPKDYVEAPLVTIYYNEETKCDELKVLDTNEIYVACFRSYNYEILEENKYSCNDDEYKSYWYNLFTIKNAYGCEMIMDKNHTNVYVPQNLKDNVLDYYNENSVLLLDDYVLTNDEKALYDSIISNLDSDGEELNFNDGSSYTFFSISKYSSDLMFDLGSYESLVFYHNEYYIEMDDDNWVLLDASFKDIAKNKWYLV